ncbi:MAG: bifunctional phosphoribosylaminoimidazolecarboxamide formyltransferase/IMP cyclohydrolase [Phycisphaerales bacterium]|nr:bifunctional phosphoribosylaminoimidazolecarboxamide formyltransferase/IMP cyclohydrolase [Phycisphaerales bacterium]
MTATVRSGVPAIRRALLSVWDKTGIEDIARILHEDLGVELVSTGGTARLLRQAGLAVTLVEQVTGFPEVLGGRVKTLHPHIHAAILANRDDPAHLAELAAHGIAPLDLVIVDLYPFERTVADPGCNLAQALEMIDIGGVTLLRAAAKNHEHVLVLTDPADRKFAVEALRDGSMTVEGWAGLRRTYAARAFQQVASYDAAVARYLGSAFESDKEVEQFPFYVWDRPRYGENPHQAARVLRPCECKEAPRTLSLLPQDTPLDTAHPARLLKSETELSYNNYLDADAALGLCAELTRATPGHTTATAGTAPQPACVFVKHTNACGVGVAPTAIEAYRRAYLGDPNAAMGGILAVNFPVEADFAALVLETYGHFGKPLKDRGAAYAPGGFFVEVWLAPSFTNEALEVIRGERAGNPSKDWGRRVRLLPVGDLTTPLSTLPLLRSIAGGVLAQEADALGLHEAEWEVATERSPSASEWADLRLAWLINKHTKSNAITLCRAGALLGNGAGQMSRVMSCRLATWLARENGHADALPGAVAASDAFFPFADGPEILIAAGITALIQPGGSKRDADTVAVCNARGVAMVYTRTRHFRH